MTQNTQETMSSAPAEPVSAPKPKAKPGAGKRRAKKIVKTVITLLVIAGILGGGGVALYRFLNTNDEQVGEIYALPAEIGSITSSVSGSGSARAKESAAITLPSNGTVQELFITAGDIVFAGQPLYTMTSPAAMEVVDTAQAAVDRAQEQVTRAQEQVAAQQEVVVRLQEQLNDKRASMGDLTITAPFSGKLTDVQSFHTDDQVSAGTPVATLVNDRTLRLSLYFSYAYENSIYVGQPAQVTIPAVMGTQQGKVDEIHKVSYITPEGAIFFEVVISFSNPGTLTAGMDASAVMTAADGTDIYPYEGGKTEFYESRTITAKVPGPVTGTGNLFNYANVSAGEVLLTLGPDSINEDIREIQQQIDKAQESVKSAREGVDTAEAAVTKALEDLDKAQEDLNLLNAEAPIDGTVITCSLSEGEEAKGGETVIIISNNTTMLVDITVDDRNISFLHPGDTVDLDWNGNIYQGRVTAINMGNAQQGSGMTRYPVTLSVENWDGSLMDGAWLQYSFVTSQSDECVVVPSGAVRYFSDMDGNRQSVVFVQRDERPDDVPELQLPEQMPGQDRTYPSEEEGYYPVIVETGLANTQNVEIVSGVEAGDMVFINYSVINGAWG